MGLPQGTVTFLFTDLEGSTRRWEAHPELMRDALARHDAIVRGAVESHGGVVFSTMGDGMAAVFASARDAARSPSQSPDPALILVSSRLSAWTAQRPAGRTGKSAHPHGSDLHAGPSAPIRSVIVRADFQCACLSRCAIQGLGIAVSQTLDRTGASSPDPDSSG